jgi:hypothetical protein
MEQQDGTELIKRCRAGEEAAFSAVMALAWVSTLTSRPVSK